MTYTSICFFCIIVCGIHKKKTFNFLSNSYLFKFLRCTTFDQYFWLEITNTYTTSTSFAHFVYSFCPMTPYSCIPLDLAFFVFCFSLKGQHDYISLISMILNMLHSRVPFFKFTNNLEMKLQTSRLKVIQIILTKICLITPSET